MLAKDLLAPDGVIFISIDNNEQANLKVICDAIFGEENFLTMLSRRTKVGGGSAANYFALENDYVMVWAKSIEDLPNLYAPFDEKYLKRYSEEDEKGRFFWDTMERSCTATTPYKIEAPDGTILSGNWFRSEQRFLNDKANGEVRFLKKAEGEWSVQFKQRLPEGKKIRTFLNDNNFKSSQDDLDELGMGGMFEHPKPVYLINYLLQGCLSKDSIVLDFFSGSATTAQAVMRMNTATDGGLRKFIMVQWAEKTKENSEARNAGYNTIDEIGQERIRRAAKKIKEENPLFAGDLGFKHYTLVEPSDQTFAKLEEFNPRMMFTDDNILNEFGRDTVLRTWLVRDGYGFNAEVETLDLDGYEAYVCGRHLYFVNPGLGMDSKHIIALVDLYNSGKSFKPENVVIFGYSFTYTETEELKKNLLPLRDSIKNLKVNLDIRY